MNANELTSTKDEKLTDTHSKFLIVHQNILNAGSAITTSVISLAKNLKMMRDEKLYLESGCDSFEAYAEELCGLKRSQAYSYIQILERLGEDFVQSTGQIGITKLVLLSSLTEKEKTEVVEKVDVETVSVKKLQSEIASLKSKINFFENKPPEIQIQEDTKSKEKVKELQEKLKNMTEQFKAAQEQYKISSGQAADYKKQLSLNNDKTVIEFKLKFDALQAQIIDITSMIDKLPEERRKGCKAALKKVVEVLC